MQKIGVDKQKMVCGLGCRVRRLSENEGCARGLRRNAEVFFDRSDAFECTHSPPMLTK
jgi:hypothetical protein